MELYKCMCQLVRALPCFWCWLCEMAVIFQEVFMCAWSFHFLGKRSFDHFYFNHFILLYSNWHRGNKFYDTGCLIFRFNNPRETDGMLEWGTNAWMRDVIIWGPADQKRSQCDVEDGLFSWLLYHLVGWDCAKLVSCCLDRCYSLNISIGVGGWQY